MICADLRVSSLHSCSPTERSFTPESLRSLVERSSSFSLEVLELRAEARTSQLFSDSVQWLSLHNGKCYCVNVISVKKHNYRQTDCAHLSVSSPKWGLTSPGERSSTPLSPRLLSLKSRYLRVEVWVARTEARVSQLSLVRSQKLRLGGESNIWININKQQGSLNIYKHSQTCTVPFNFQQHSTEGIYFFISFYFSS